MPLIEEKLTKVDTGAKRIVSNVIVWEDKPEIADRVLGK